MCTLRMNILDFSYIVIRGVENKYLFDQAITTIFKVKCTTHEYIALSPRGLK